MDLELRFASRREILVMAAEAVGALATVNLPRVSKMRVNIVEVMVKNMTMIVVTP